MATKKDSVELLPEDTENNSATEGLRVNFSEEEASSEARDFDPLPSGKYLVAITGIEDRACGPESKNPGKPYWALEFTVQEGDFENRKLWTNAMLFEGALYTTSQLLKATGHADAIKTGNIPSKSELLTQQVVVNVVRTRDKWREQQEDSKVNLFKNEVKGIRSASDGVGSSSQGESLLPS
jgi:hypothetical protein